MIQHRGPRTDFNLFDMESNGGPSYSLKGVEFGNKAIQIRDWRIKQIDDTHISISTANGNVARIYRSDGTSEEYRLYAFILLLGSHFIPPIKSTATSKVSMDSLLNWESRPVHMYPPTTCRWETGASAPMTPLISVSAIDLAAPPRFTELTVRPTGGQGLTTIRGPSRMAKC